MFPEVIEKADRRRFTEEYKRRIAIEAEILTDNRRARTLVTRIPGSDDRGTLLSL